MSSNRPGAVGIDGPDVESGGRDGAEVDLVEGSLDGAGQLHGELNARRIEAEQKLYRTLRDRYQIVVEPPSKAAASESAR